MNTEKCQDCPTQNEELKNPNVAFECFRSLSNKQIIATMFTVMLGVIGSAFSLGSYYTNQLNQKNQVSCLMIAVDSLSKKQDNLFYNVKRIADFLDKKSYIPSNLATLENERPKKVIMCDNRLPPQKRKSQRITHSSETAINNKENIEDIILE